MMNCEGKIKRFTALVLAIVLAGTSLAGTACSKITATAMKLMKTEGTVGIADGKEKDIEPAEGLNLYSGYRMSTEAQSYAWIDLDSVKLAKMDAESRIEIQKTGKKLEILLNAGSLFFHVTEPLKEDETMEIRTSSMMVGIRGTCGWVEAADPDHMRVYILEGTVECAVTNPETERGKSAYISGGEMAVLTAYSGDKDGEIDIHDFTPGDIPEYVLEEVLEDDDLLEKIRSDSDMDLLNWEEEPETTEEEPETAEEEDSEGEDAGLSEETAAGWREAYWEIITQTVDTAFAKYPDRLDRHPVIPPTAVYLLYDINEDGIPELVTTTSGSADVLYSYYTYSQEQGAVLVGEDWRTVRSGIYTSGSQFLVVDAERNNEGLVNELQSVYLVTLPGGQMEIQYLGMQELDGLDALSWAYDDDPSALDGWGAAPSTVPSN